MLPCFSSYSDDDKGQAVSGKFVKLFTIYSKTIVFFFSSYTYLQDKTSQEDIKEAQCGQEGAQKLLRSQTDIVRDVPFVTDA